MKTVKIIIEEQTYEIDQKVFRRIIVSAASPLETLKRIEKGGFPKVDQEALDQIRAWQYQHKELI